ncbi:MAG: PAS domain S-box protein [Chitinophagaceae bacterium]|nr:PAS domain S-box protein [Chitinophagaceae bacterium]
MSRKASSPVDEAKFLREILGLSPFGVFQADPDGNCFYINRPLEDIYGLSLEEALGWGWMSVVYEDDIAYVKSFILEMLQEKKDIIEFSYRFHHKTKGLRWCSIRSRFVFDEQGVPMYYFGFLEDITEKTLQEKVLEETNERLKQSEVQLLRAKEQMERTVSLLDASQEISKTGGWEYDVKTDTVFRTKQMKIMLGITGDTTTLDDATSLYEEEDDKAIQKGMQEAIRDQKIYDLELRPKGTKKWFRTIGKPVVKDGKVELVRGAVTDITERKEIELALREIKEKLERSNILLDVSQQLSDTAGWEVNFQTGEVFWTRQAYLVYEVGDDFVVTLDSSRAFYDEEDLRRTDAIVDAAMREKKSFDIELWLTTAKGRRKRVRAIGSPVIKDEEVVAVQGALMDITKIKETEAALIQAKELAENSARAKTDFLSVMSHEIRTPLNGIIGIANLLKLNYTMDQEAYITNLIFCADHLLQLINDILDLTKMESEKLELVYAEVNLFQLVRNIRSQFKSLAEAKGIQLKSFIDDEIPQHLLADPIRLGQILNNLVSNAIKFTEQGEVTLLVRLAAINNNKATVHFSIKDSGIGIPKHLHETIFESFKQVQQSAYRKHSGTGLGLTITRKLVELHNSRIFVKSSPGVGTEFYFDLTFDLLTDKNSPARFAVSQAISGYEKKLSGLRLLFVEDNPINVMVAVKQLEYFGVVPDCAHSGKEALALLSDNDYHVALLDLHMPEIDGYALAEIIRRQYPGIHIVIFTADIMTEVKVKLAKMNIYDILNKPFAPEKMFDILLNVAQAKKVPGQGQFNAQDPGVQ